MSTWKNCNRILCIRPDNMGDLIMSGPAIRALKQTFGCHITLLTSPAASGVVDFMDEIDEMIIFHAPWAQASDSLDSAAFSSLVTQLSEGNFDGAVIFTVFSQSALPTALIAYLARIPLVLAYARENPYQLLTDWLPDQEPYLFVQHQVKRDLALVAAIGAHVSDDGLRLRVSHPDRDTILRRLHAEGLDADRPWLIVHTGLSEAKREYSPAKWMHIIRMIVEDMGYQVLLSGNTSERPRIDRLLVDKIPGVYNIAGRLKLKEFIGLVDDAPLMITLNTGPAHIAAAVKTPVLVLYALSNPQHLPWKAIGKALFFDIPEEMRSRNQVISFVQNELHPQDVPMVRPQDVIDSARQILATGFKDPIPELVPLRPSPHYV